MRSEPALDPALFKKVRAPLELAETLPPWCYTSDDFYRAEVSKIFLKCWNFVGRVDLAPKPGDYFTVDLVGVPIIVVRAKDNELRAFGNTCRHRGARLVNGEGNLRAFRCPYHSWVYDLNGQLKGCAGMEEAGEFDRAQFGLVPVRLETWGGFVFVNFDDRAQSLAEYLGDFPKEFASYDCENLITTRRTEYDLACNWKIFIENAMEEYHVPHVHRVSISKLEVGHNIVAGAGNWCAIREKHEGTRALLEEDQAHALPEIKTLQGPPAEGSHFVCLYPATMLGMTKDCVWWLEERPQGPHRIKLVFGACFPKETVARADFSEKVKYYYKRWDKSIREDNEISEVQHAGLSSPLARPGRYSHLEPLVHDIANWVLDRVLDDKVASSTAPRRRSA